MNIKYNNTSKYAPSVKKTGKRKDANRMIDNGDFYRSRKWRRLRAEVIKECPLCEHCSSTNEPVLADVVDHKIPLFIDETLALDRDNLQSLCHQCHNKKTQEDKKKYDEYNNYDNFYFG